MDRVLKNKIQLQVFVSFVASCHHITIVEIRLNGLTILLSFPEVTCFARQHLNRTSNLQPLSPKPSSVTSRQQLSASGAHMRSAGSCAPEKCENK